MDPSTLITFYLIAFMVLWGVLVVGLIFWKRKQRKTRWPFEDTDKLLRSPGETLKRRIHEMDENFVLEFIAIIVTAVIILPLGGFISTRLGLKGVASLVAVFSGPLIVLVGSVWRMGKLWETRSCYFLGWFGERMTAELLRPLQLQGYRVFHDVPGKPGKEGFNIDHVVIGPPGVAIVETKTRRKGNARKGFKDHEVKFDGNRLIWPWGEDRKYIQQTINEADWIEKWIHDRTGLKVSVKRILALPGWFVHESPSSRIRVVNPKILPDVVRGRGELVLSAQQIDLIARQVDLVCRDVAD